ncbi:hypothetical protein Tco_1042906 [Tanacetum coccineum]|uniref:Uncharacterized protein n=1 Tax=Tanacetum coccineum TaxID=301880 RepID=A0ABQ5GLU2_9ASTR
MCDPSKHINHIITDVPVWQEGHPLEPKDRWREYYEAPLKKDHFRWERLICYYCKDREDADSQCPARARVLNDLSVEEKEMYKSRHSADHILLQDGKVVVSRWSVKIQSNNQEDSMTRNNARGNGIAGKCRMTEQRRLINPVQTTSGLKNGNLNGKAHESGRMICALNVGGHILKADECDAFDSDVDEESEPHQGNFCDSDLEVGLQKHKIRMQLFRDINGTKTNCKAVACQLGKSKKFSHRPKSENTNMEVLHTLHMDLCGPMRDESKWKIEFGLEELVPSVWVESERKYDISAVYGITHWWFRRKEFYINKHSEPSDYEAVRS